MIDLPYTIQPGETICCHRSNHGGHGWTYQYIHHVVPVGPDLETDGRRIPVPYVIHARGFDEPVVLTAGRL